MDTQGNSSSGKSSSNSGQSEKVASPPKPSVSSESAIQPTNDPVRNKCREMIQNSLNVDKDKYSSNMVSLMAARVEGEKFHGLVNLSITSLAQSTKLNRVEMRLEIIFS